VTCFRLTWGKPEDKPYGEKRAFFWNDDAIHSLALSRDGRLLACGDEAGRVWIFDWVR